MSDYYPTGADGHSLIMPFVTCASKGGPHDAQGIVEGGDQ